MGGERRPAGLLSTVGPGMRGSAVSGHRLFLSLLKTLQVLDQDFGEKITFNAYISVPSPEVQMNVKMSELSASL